MAGCAASVAGRAAETSQTGLAAVAAGRGLRYGAAPFSYPPIITPDYERLVAEQCGLIAPVLNWRLTSPTPGSFRADTDLGAVAFARAHGLALTGFHLLWHEAAPAWFGGLRGRAAAARVIEAHIASMGEAYAGMTWSVNVVNEILDPEGGRNDGLRQDAFAAQLGGAYLEIAFRAARQAFPGALLLLNEYGTEQGADRMAHKRAALLDRLDGLRTAGAPIDGVGLQSHLTLDRPFDEEGFAVFLRRISERGLRIVATELDVLDIGAPSAIKPRDQAVADMYRRYLEVLLASPAVCGVVTWGLSDRYTWLTRATSQGFARPDGLPTRPLPFDGDLRPKPACRAMLDAFRAAPSRTPL